LKREIQLNAREPTNLAFGGKDGKTVFVTQRQGGFVESFRTDTPGREACLRGCPARK
jgi:signal peptidase